MSNASHVTKEELRKKNRELYDDATNDLWRMVVYEPVHAGWEFTNIGGSRLLNVIGKRFKRGSAVLEVCSGSGDVARYLVEHFDCHVTGIDINPRQIAHARKKQQTLPEHVRSRLTFVEADATEWQPQGQYDWMLSVDSLMLIDDVETVLLTGRRALKPDGRLTLAEVTAGACLSDATRDFAWRVDGIVTLLTTADYRHLLSATGFEVDEADDLTESAERCFDLISRTLHYNRESVVNNFGKNAFSGWSRVAELYRDAFHRRELLYTHISARHQ